MIVGGVENKFGGSGAQVEGPSCVKKGWNEWEVFGNGCGELTMGENDLNDAKWVQYT